MRRIFDSEIARVDQHNIAVNFQTPEVRLPWGLVGSIRNIFGAVKPPSFQHLEFVATIPVASHLSWYLFRFLVCLSFPLEASTAAGVFF